MMKLFSVLLVLTFCGVASASKLSADLHAKEGADHLVDWLEEYQEAMKEAQEKAQKEAQRTGKQPQMPKVTIPEEKLNLAINEMLLSLAEDSSRPDVHINLGLAFELKKSEKQALSEYETAIKLAENNPAVKFVGLFNKARLLGQMKEIDKALESYQSALAIIPDSKEVKTNIELLWQQGGGGGGEDQQQQNQDQSGNEDQQQDQQQQPDQNEDQKQKQKPQNLSKEDVKRILEEIKSQEQKIRANEQKLGGKEGPREKDW